MIVNMYIKQRIFEYLNSVSLREPPLLQRLRQETASFPDAHFGIPPEHGQFMSLLLQLMGAEKTIEIGVFTGYSSLVTALALPPHGRIVACDVSEEYTSVARRYWKEAGVDHKIDLRLKPAMETLHELLAQGQRGAFDFAFIDADKQSQDGYYEACLELLRPGGLIMVDNVLLHGDALDPLDGDPRAVATRAFNQKLLGDERVSLSMLVLGDGVALAVKR